MLSDEKYYDTLNISSLKKLSEFSIEYKDKKFVEYKESVHKD